MLGEFAPRGGGADRVCKIGVFVLQRLDALVELRQVDRRRGTRLPGVDSADGERRTRLALDPQRGGIERQGEILRTSVLSPEGRSTVTTRVTLAPSG